MTDREPPTPEIVIVRRRVSDDMAAGKGGSWKIAYADFVTAMMAFFLVMWLINASNEETRAQVASYFNPIKLTDTKTGPKSVKDVKNDASSQALVDEIVRTSNSNSEDRIREGAVLRNPPEVLDRIEEELTGKLKRSAIRNDYVGTANSRTEHNSPVINDPFDPLTARTLEHKDNSNELSKSRPDDRTDKSLTPDIKNQNTQSIEIDGHQLLPIRESGNSKGQAFASSVGKNEVAPEKKTDQEKKVSDLLKNIAEDLRISQSELGQRLEIRLTPEGLLVNLTESANFEMFKTGSAEPEPRMLELMKAVSKAIQSSQGNISIRGHTDARPFRNRYFDNWQLSTARAHMAREMLIRAGVSDRRIQSIEGVADREPRNPSNPLAPENRRIELLISNSKP